MSTSGARYVVMTVECRHCKTKQTVHVAAGVGMTAKQIIRCIKCQNYFDVMLPDKIVGCPLCGIIFQQRDDAWPAASRYM